MTGSRHRAIVLTTINGPTLALKGVCASFPDWTIIVAGDGKTPPNWSLNGVDFLSITEQRSLSFELAAALPENHYCRKNLGYLLAIRNGAEKIAEIDDDNFPTSWSIGNAEQLLDAPMVDTRDWFNVYELFADDFIWPRGYPLELLQASRQRMETTPRGQYRRQTASCPVQQWLAEGDPDVDALYRLTVGKTDHTFTDGQAIFGRGTMVPFNSQSTLWFPDAYMYMYIPSFAGMRMFDIWRSFIAQVCIWAHGHHVAYHGRGVYQQRDGHDLLRDFRDEVIGYANNSVIAIALTSLDLSVKMEDAGLNLRRCYETLVDLNLISSSELPLVDAWINDVQSVTP